LIKCACCCYVSKGQGAKRKGIKGKISPAESYYSRVTIEATMSKALTMIPLKVEMKTLLRTLLITLLLGLFPGCATQGDEEEANSNDMEMQTIYMEMQVPDANWKLAIEEIYEVDDELWVIAQLNREPGNAAQVITDVFDTVGVFSLPKPIRYYVIGKTWSWGNSDDGFNYIAKRTVLNDDLVFGKLLYSRNKAAE